MVARSNPARNVPAENESDCRKSGSMPAVHSPKKRLVNSAEKKAPTDMKPAWPIENCPAEPMMRLSPTAREMFRATL